MSPNEQPVQVGFYHLTRTPLERALPKLLEKAHGTNKSVLLLAHTQRMEALDQLLWTYSPDSFMPHAVAGAGADDAQPVLIADRVAPREIICVTNGDYIDQTADCERVLDMFDGNNDQQLQQARGRWKQYKEAGCVMSYFQQTDAGGWEKKAS